MQNTIKKNKIRSLILVWAFSFFLPAAHAQSKNDRIQVTGTATNYTLTTAAMLEAVQTLSNSITLDVVAKDNRCSIYAMVSGSSTTSSTPMPASLLALQLSSISPPLPANFSTIQLSQTNQLLFQSSASFNHESLVYNLLLGPVGYNYNPGTYSFTILFTMTQP